MNAMGGLKRFRQLRAIFKSLKGGVSIAQACKATNIDVATLWRWRRENPKLNKLIYDVIDSRVQMVEDALFKSAIEGSVTAQQVFLFNRAPDRWQDKRAMPNIFKNDPINSDEIEILNGDGKKNEHRLLKFLSN